jgi:hypothetical protein
MEYTKKEAYLRNAAAVFLSMEDVYAPYRALSLTVFSELKQKSRSGTNRVEMTSREG